MVVAASYGQIFDVAATGKGLDDDVAEGGVGVFRRGRSDPGRRRRALPKGAKRGEMWGAFSGDEPLGDRQPRVAGESNLARAPWLLCRPLNESVAVLASRPAPEAQVSFRVVGTAVVRVETA